jgi:hypothetical protein
LERVSRILQGMLYKIQKNPTSEIKSQSKKEEEAIIGRGIQTEDKHEVKDLDNNE